MISTVPVEKFEHRQKPSQIKGERTLWLSGIGLNYKTFPLLRDTRIRKEEVSVFLPGK